MRVQIEPLDHQPDSLVIKVEGVVDSTTLEDFFRAIAGVFSGDTKNLLLDLSGMSFISSGGLSVISDVYKKAHALGGKVFIVGASEQVRELFGVVGFERIFPFYRDIHEAKENL